jgi:uncharacterized protein YjiS (DUF1127 family)
MSARKPGDSGANGRLAHPVQKISRTNQGNVKALGDGACSNSIASSGHQQVRPPADFEIHGQISPFQPGSGRGEQANCPLIAHRRLFLTETIVSTISRAPSAAQTAPAPSWTALLRARFNLWKAAYCTWRIEQSAIQQLEGMSDHDLRDIGLTRAEIPHAVTHDTARDRAFRR